jgi:hypothetical protein
MRAPLPIPVGARVRYSAEKVHAKRRNLSGFDYMRPDPKRLQAERWLADFQAWRGVVTAHLSGNDATSAAPGYEIAQDGGGIMRCLPHVVEVDA